jgi:single-stranded DNA-specific DHH superfamily exonuclease
MPCKEICGATVALKVCCALAQATGLDSEKQKEMIDSMMPFTAIATVADCMPLVHENRLIVTE